MEVISFHESDRQDHWLEEIKRSDWKSGAFLYELLSQGTFFDTVGENSKVLLLIDENELISYCTYALKDDIQPTELTPWMGFVYTFPEHRGHHYIELLFNEIERLAQEKQVSQVYISTNHVGLYEKYGCEFLTEMKDLDGNPSRIYVKKVDIPSQETEETAMQEWEVPPVPEIEIPPIPETQEPCDLEIESRPQEHGINKVLTYLTTKKKWAVLKRAFHIWQITPPKLAPLSESTHECTSCGTTYQGNYCPRCGQSSTVGRFSFKKALQHFLDVWGMGNRSMFRSLRDLMLRPGYMIRDYLSGMQSAYFPPFKMFFVLLTFFIIIEQGLKLDLDTTAPQLTINQTEMVKQVKEEVKQVKEEVKQDKEEVKQEDKEVRQEDKKDVSNKVEKKTAKMKPLDKLLIRFVNLMKAMWDKNPAIFSLVTILLLFWPMYFFLHQSPKIPELRFSEFIVAMVYTSNSFTIYMILGDLLNYQPLQAIAVFIIFVALRQLSGYKKRRILIYLIISLVISVIAVLLVAGGGIGLASLFVSE